MDNINNQVLAACKDDQDDWLSDLMAHNDFDISFADDNGNTALHYAAQHGSLACLELLIEVSGVEIDRKNKGGTTPLHYAVTLQDDIGVALEMVNVLLDAGANPRIQNANKQSALSLANTIPNEEDMKELLTSVLIEYDDDDDDQPQEEYDNDVKDKNSLLL
ncbi:ankyrin repeat-containing domain protein [Chlamydoabsidia padenii]|nr:ankyrin repeat-containing domain protein [Chlamydoabsidia padenii]